MTTVGSWANGPMLGFDLETTGVDVETDRAVTMALVEIRPGYEPVKHEWLINPGIPISAEAEAVNGISNEHVRRHGMPPAEAWGEALAIMTSFWLAETPLVAYNLAFDVTMADRELARHLGLGAPINGRHMVDPIVIGRANHPRQRGWKLAQACERYGVVLTEQDAHTATGDVMATLRLAYKMASMWPRTVGRVGLPQLQAQQHDWHHQFCMGMARWLRGQADKMDHAWRSGNHAEVRRQMSRLKITEDLTDDLVAATCAGTRARADSFATDASTWPMRQRPAVAPEPVGAGAQEGEGA